MPTAPSVTRLAADQLIQPTNGDAMTDMPAAKPDDEAADIAAWSESHLRQCCSTSGRHWLDQLDL